MTPDPNLIKSMDELVEGVLCDCVEQFFPGDARGAFEALRQKRADISRVYTERLGQAIARHLASDADVIKEIYRFQMDPGHVRAQEQDLEWSYRQGIHLVVWVREKSSRFQERVEAMTDCLLESGRRKGFSEGEGSFPVEIHLVDDEEVRGQLGYGLFPAGEVIRSERIWPRQRTTARDRRQGGLPRGEEGLLEELTTFDPKLAPEDRILEHAFSIARIPEEQRGALDYHLMDLKVNLIRKMISDQLRYINIAKEWFQVEDLADLYQRRMGSGKIGGKAAGMTLAYRILQETAGEQVREAVQIPESYFLGSDLIYIFMAMNGLMHWNDQKYKPEEVIWEEYPEIQREFQGGEFPPEVVAQLGGVLDHLAGEPIIVRSSSQLEDNFGTAFAGKYDSYFLPNQGSREENLRALTQAVSRIYASTLKPEALLYRRQRGLQDYDERMAVLIQQVQGERLGRYFLPHGAGVAFSKNIYRWSPEIRREDGFVRLVWGLGTRAVARVSEDYPRLIALSHPRLQPDDSVEALRRYSQQRVDLLDLEANEFCTLPVSEVLTPEYGPLPYLIQIDQGGYLASPRMRVKEEELSRAVVNFQKTITGTPFVGVLKEMLEILEERYHDAVDLEFTVGLPGGKDPEPGFKLSLLQCRPQPHLREVYDVQLPAGVPEEEIIFSSEYLVPRGYLPEVRQVIFIDPQAYYDLSSPSERSALSRGIAKLNRELGEKEFICVGPGRWGSVNPDLGVFVSYADIHRTGALIELTGSEIGPDPEPSLGTHFFQDLMEAGIYPLAINFNQPDTIFNQEFFYETENAVSRWLDLPEALERCLRVIPVEAYRPGTHLEVVMDDRENKSLAYVVRDD